jgi:hypothetical protein
VERASLNNGLNYLADTLMFCGAVLLLAGAMPRETWSGAKHRLTKTITVHGNEI